MNQPENYIDLFLTFRESLIDKVLRNVYFLKQGLLKVPREKLIQISYSA